MIRELYQSPSIYHPSDFWTKLNKQHLYELEKQGFSNFKRTINVRYFSWRILGILRHQLTPFFFCLKNVNINPLIKSSFKHFKTNLKSIYSFNLISSFIYKVYIAALAEFVSSIDEQKLLLNVKEPRMGNPFIINYNSLEISQDICNSIHEYYSTTSLIKLKKKAQIAELGAGYGRLAYVFLKALPQITYTIIDIPPALYISQMYLSKVFPKETIFTFRTFKSFTNIKNNFEKSRIRFLLPHQLEMIPKKYFDLTINISSMHEMSKPQITNFINLFDKTGSGYFYTKQWRKSRTQDNNFITEHEYPIPSRWKLIYHRTHPIQNLFFEALYQT